MYMVCQSDKPSAQFTWLINGVAVKTPSLGAELITKKKSLLRIGPEDFVEFKNSYIYVSCFVPPLFSKRIKIRIANGELFFARA